MLAIRQQKISPRLYALRMFFHDQSQQYSPINFGCTATSCNNDNTYSHI